jgi:hypothetical protein
MKIQDLWNQYNTTTDFQNCFICHEKWKIKDNINDVHCEKCEVKLSWIVQKSNYIILSRIIGDYRVGWLHFNGADSNERQCLFFKECEASSLYSEEMSLPNDLPIDITEERFLALLLFL